MASSPRHATAVSAAMPARALCLSQLDKLVGMNNETMPSNSSRLTDQVTSLENLTFDFQGSGTSL
jgi:hypothetical protein